MGLQKPRKQHWKMVSSKLCKAARMWSKNSDYTIGRVYLEGAMISQTLKTESMLKKIYSGLPHNKYTLINKQAGIFFVYPCLDCWVNKISAIFCQYKIDGALINDKTLGFGILSLGSFWNFEGALFFPINSRLICHINVSCQNFVIPSFDSTTKPQKETRWSCLIW